MVHELGVDVQHETGDRVVLERDGFEAHRLGETVVV